MKQQTTFFGQFISQLKTSILATLVLAVVVSGIYPTIVWALAQLMFSHQANGSLIGHDGQPVTKESDAVGSALLGQNFSDAKYFHPRPSAAGNGYDATANGGSNLGPTSAKLMTGATKKDDKGVESVMFDGLNDRVVHYCLDNNIAFDSSIPLSKFKDPQGNIDDVKLIDAFNDGTTPLVFTPKTPIPADAVTASGSGLDPHISFANARLQAPRVAAARKIDVQVVLNLIAGSTNTRDLAIFGEEGVNVLKLNLALDTASASTRVGS